MELIGEKEEEEEEEDSENTGHSFQPESWPDNVSQIPHTREEIAQRNEAPTNEAKLRVLPKAVRYLPCHYFDYICGSSTGA